MCPADAEHWIPACAGMTIMEGPVALLLRAVGIVPWFLACIA